jgi:hypothetical protein
MQAKVVATKIPPELFDAIVARAEAESSSASAIIRRALRREFCDTPVSAMSGRRGRLHRGDRD